MTGQQQQTVGGLFQLFWGGDFEELGNHPFLTFVRTVVASDGASLSLLMCYDERILRFKV